MSVKFPQVRSQRLAASRFGIRASAFFRSSAFGLRPSSGFTLIEIMIVVGIMGIILTMSVPMVYKITHRAPINQATADLFEVLSNARSRAILQNKEVAVLFHPREGRFEIEGGGGQAAGKGAVQTVMSPGVGGGTSGQLSEQVAIQMLDINKLPRDFLNEETARVRFFPNGTSDELTLILNSQGEQRGIVLEVTTGLASVLNQADLQKLVRGVL